jgi:NAD(P)-dependent dehydrogenase (short-subunit alcohol dehydrogenase family)
MRARGSGRIVNISSVAGRIAAPANAAYAATLDQRLRALFGTLLGGLGRCSPVWAGPTDTSVILQSDAIADPDGVDANRTRAMLANRLNADGRRQVNKPRTIPPLGRPVHARSRRDSANRSWS